MGLDWMALAHMLAVEGSEPVLASAAWDRPMLEPDQVLLFAHDPSHSTRFERGEIGRLKLARVGLEEVREDPEGAAGRALELLAERFGNYVIHLDVDVVDFTDAPLSEHPSRNAGLKLDEMLRRWASSPRAPVLWRSRSPSSTPTMPGPTTDCWNASQSRLLMPSVRRSSTLTHQVRYQRRSITLAFRSAQRSLPKRSWSFSSTCLWM